LGGQLSAAAKILTSDGIKEPTPAVLDELTALNPTRVLPIQCPTIPLPWTVLNISNEVLQKNIRSFNTSSAAGPFGFKPSQMINLVNYVNGTYLEELLESIKFFITNII
jgi:hypothetical protein